MKNPVDPSMLFIPQWIPMSVTFAIMRFESTSGQTWSRIVLNNQEIKEVDCKKSEKTLGVHMTP